VWKRKGAQQQASRAPEWMFDSNDGAGGFDGSGNFTEDIPGHEKAADQYADDSDARLSEERQLLKSTQPTNSFDPPVEVLFAHLDIVYNFLRPRRVLPLQNRKRGTMTRLQF